MSFGYECQAEIDFANGRLDASESAATASLTRLGYPHSDFGPWPALALTLRARIRTSAGQQAAAIEDARAAVELLEADVVDAQQSATVGSARLALAEAELAAGDRSCCSCRRDKRRRVPAQRRWRRSAGDTGSRATHQTSERALERDRSFSTRYRFDFRVPSSCGLHRADAAAPVWAIDSEQQRLERKDLEPFIGSHHRVSEVLNRKRRLSIDIIRRLH